MIPHTTLDHLMPRRLGPLAELEDDFLVSGAAVPGSHLGPVPLSSDMVGPEAVHTSGSTRHCGAACWQCMRMCLLRCRPQKAANACLFSMARQLAVH